MEFVVELGGRQKFEEADFASFVVERLMVEVGGLWRYCDVSASRLAQVI